MKQILDWLWALLGLRYSNCLKDASSENPLISMNKFSYHKQQYFVGVGGLVLLEGIASQILNLLTYILSRYNTILNLMT